MAAKKALLDAQPHPLPGRLRIHETPPNGVYNGDSTIMVIKAKQLPCVATHRACRNCQRTHRLS